MNKSRRGSLVVVPNLDYVFSVRVAGLAFDTERDRQEFLDVGLLVGRVLTLVLRLLVRTVFLSLHQHQRLDHHPQTLKGGRYRKMDRKNKEVSAVTKLSSCTAVRVMNAQPEAPSVNILETLSVT